MSRSINTPTNQKRLTNISIVKLSKGGQKFEIACYVNKVDDWRCGREKDLSEVLQVPDAVFTKVSKGEVAKKQILEKCFKVQDIKEIILEILKNGDIQYSEKERKEKQENLTKEIATILADKCLDPETNKPYTAQHLVNAMKGIHFSPNPNKNAKQQALDLMTKLNDHENGLKIRRANMRISVTVPVKHFEIIKKKLLKMMNDPTFSDSGMDKIVTSDVKPGDYKIICEIVKTTVKKSDCVKLLSLKESTDSVEL